MRRLRTDGTIDRRSRRAVRWWTAVVVAAATVVASAGADAASADLRVALCWTSARLPESSAGDMEAEASAIWAALGVTLVWDSCPSARDATGPVLVVTDRPVRSSMSGFTGLGEIPFDDDGSPGTRLHISAAVALDAIEEAAEQQGALTNVPNALRRAAAVRLLGRAAAHELGHYMLASRAHATGGLMRRFYLAEEGFARGPARYGLTRPERAHLRDRLDRLAQRTAESR